MNVMFYKQVYLQLVAFMSDPPRPQTRKYDNTSPKQLKLPTTSISCPLYQHLLFCVVTFPPLLKTSILVLSRLTVKQVRDYVGGTFDLQKSCAELQCRSLLCRPFLVVSCYNIKTAVNRINNRWRLRLYQEALYGNPCVCVLSFCS